MLLKINIVIKLIQILLQYFFNTIIEDDDKSKMFLKIKGKNKYYQQINLSRVLSVGIAYST